MVKDLFKINTEPGWETNSIRTRYIRFKTPYYWLNHKFGNGKKFWFVHELVRDDYNDWDNMAISNRPVFNQDGYSEGHMVRVKDYNG